MKNKKNFKTVDLKTLKLFKVYCFPPGYYKKEELLKYYKIKQNDKDIENFLKTWGFSLVSSRPELVHLTSMRYRVDGYYIKNKKAKKNMDSFLTYDKGLPYVIDDIFKRK